MISLKSRAVLNLIIASAFCGYVYVLQFMISVMTNDLMKDLQISPEQIGLLASAFFYVYAPIQLFAGYLHGRYGPHLILTVSIAFCTSGIVGFLATDSLYLIIFFRTFMGIGAGFSVIGTYVLITQWFPVKYWAFLFGVIQLVCCAGAFLGQSSLALLLEFIHWRQIAILLVAFGGLLTIVTFVGLKDHPKYRGKDKSKSPHFFEQLKIILKNKRSIWIASYCALTWGPITFFAGLWGIPYLMMRYSISNTSAALLMAFVWIGVGIGNPLFGGLCIKGHRVSPMLLSSTIGVIAGFALIYLPQLPVYSLCVVLFFLGVATSGQPVAFVAIQECNPKQVRSTVTGLNNAAVVGSSIIFQPLASYLINLSATHHSISLANLTFRLSDFVYGFKLIPLCYILSILVLMFYVTESAYLKAKATTQAEKSLNLN